MSTKSFASVLLISGLMALTEGVSAHEANEINPTDQLDDVLRRADETHERLTEKRKIAETERQYSLQEKENLDRRRKRRQERQRQEDPSLRHYMPDYHMNH